jgi:cell division septum initiation protein DivIVA
MSTEHFAETATLPTAFRGYARDAVEDLIKKMKDAEDALDEERGALTQRLVLTERRAEKLERQLEESRGQTQAVSDALIAAERLKAASERRAEKIEEDARRAAAEARTFAERQAAEILRQAEEHGKALVAEVQQSLDARRYETEDFLEDTHQRLSSLMRDLVDRAAAAAQGGLLSEPSAPEEREPATAA